MLGEQIQDASIPWAGSVIAALFGFALLGFAALPQSWRERFGWLKINNSYGDGFRPHGTAPVSAATLGGRVLLAFAGVAMLAIATLLGLHAAA